MINEEIPQGVIYLPSGSGRSYPMGGMRSVFKADGEETTDTYSISEWWLEAHQSGPGAGFLNIYIPGGFEQEMPAIVDWFKERGAGNAG